MSENKDVDNENMKPQQDEAAAVTAGNASVEGETPQQDGIAPATTTIRVKERVRTGKHRTGKKKKRSGKKIAIIVICVIAVIVACLGVGFAYMKHKGQENMTTPPAQDQELTVKYKGHEYMYNDSAVSILFEGIDDESGYSDKSCSDANFLATIDTSTNKVVLTTIPRDAECEVDIYQDNKYAFTTTTNLCLAYAQDADKKTCAKNVAQSVSTIMEDSPVKYYFAMNVHAIEDLVDAVDGVTVTALQTIPGTSVVKGKKITLKGDDAYKYVQYRDTNVSSSSLDRQARQEQFLKAFIKKASKMSVDKLLKVVNTVSDYSTTNIGASELTYLATRFVTGGNGGVEMNNITGKVKSKLYEEDGLMHEYVVLSDKSVHAAVIAAYYKQIGE